MSSLRRGRCITRRPISSQFTGSDMTQATISIPEDYLDRRKIFYLRNQPVEAELASILRPNEDQTRSDTSYPEPTGIKFGTNEIRRDQTYLTLNQLEKVWKDHRRWQDLFCTLNQLKRFDMYPLDVGHLLRPTSAQSN